MYSKVLQLYIYVYILFQILFHYTVLQDIEYSSLCYTVGTCCFLYLLRFRHSRGYIMTSYHGSMWHFPDDQLCWEPFHVFKDHSETGCTWDLRPFAAVLAPGQMFPWATKYKETIGTEKNGIHDLLGQIMDKKIQKDQKSPTANSEEPGEKQGPGSKSRVLHMHPAHTTTKGVGKPPKPPLWPDLWTRPYPHPIEGSSSSSLGSKEGNLLLVFTPSCCHRSPNKALPEFLVWPLTNFY